MSWSKPNYPIYMTKLQPTTIIGYRIFPEPISSNIRSNDIHQKNAGGGQEGSKYVEQISVHTTTQALYQITDVGHQ